MQSYLLRNDNVQHRHRELLVAHYEKERGRPVPFAEILHMLMEKEVKRLSLLPKQ